MRFFVYIAAALPLVSAVAVPSPEDNQMTDTLDVIHRLLEDEKIDLINDKTLGKRWDVPGLDCGSTRALRCAQKSIGTLSSCVWGVLLKGRDIKEDTKCQAAITSFRYNMPDDCKLCLARYIH